MAATNVMKDFPPPGSRPLHKTPDHFKRSNVARLYFTVINDVINGVREHFIDEGLDEHSLQELKSLWEKKLMESKAIDPSDAMNVIRPVTQTGLPHHSLLQPTLVQYRGAPGTPTQLVRVQGDSGAKTVTILPNKGMTITLPSGISPSNIQSLMSGAASTATLALPPEITNQWIQPNGQPVQFQQLSRAAMGGTKPTQFLATAGGQPAGTQVTAGGKQFTLVRVPGPASAAAAAQQAAGGPQKFTIVKMPTSAQQQQRSANLVRLTTPRPSGSQPGMQQNITFLRVPPPNPAQQQIAGAQPQFTLATTAQPPTSQPPSGPFSVDGHGGETSEDDDEDDFNDDDDKDGDDDDQDNEDLDGNGEEEDPLNSNDDVSDDDGDAQDIFDIDNVVVCQYDKISRSRNRWKFQFKDGIMNLEGKDYVFQKALGDAEW